MDEKTGIWGEKEVAKGYQCDFVLAGLIGRCYKNAESVADVGCGIGRYARIFKAFGYPIVHGYEGSVAAINCDFYIDIVETDLSKLQNFKMKYDLVISLEVGEHIPKKYESIFIDNVCNLAKKDVVLSWGVIGQGGRGHFNEQPNEYIINEMKKRGFNYNKKWTEWMRYHCFLKWFKNSLMIFYKKEEK